jgi:hypothetical protein
MKRIKDIAETSYHGDFIEASFFELASLFGLPDIEYEEKVNYCWELQTDEGIQFSIYDWKYYRPLLVEEPIIWHIGTDSEEHSKIIKQKLDKLLY